MATQAAQTVAAKMTETGDTAAEPAQGTTPTTGSPATDTPCQASLLSQQPARTQQVLSRM